MIATLVLLAGCGGQISSSAADDQGAAAPSERTFDPDDRGVGDDGFGEEPVTSPPSQGIDDGNEADSDLFSDFFQ